VATQINGRSSKDFGGTQLTVYNLSVITSGTTVTITLPVGTKVRNLFVYDITAGTIITGSTYVESTGVFTSGTLTLNDVVEVSFITERSI